MSTVKVTAGILAVLAPFSVLLAFASAETLAETTEQECGIASYYADSLAGNSTASGEPYTPASMTAAHRTLPFGAMVRVTRESGEEVVVRINDRGPHTQNRIIDLSGAAAEAIGLTIAGIAPVCLTLVDDQG